MTVGVRPSGQAVRDGGRWYDNELLDVVKNDKWLIAVVWIETFARVTLSLLADYRQAQLKSQKRTVRC